MQPTLHCDEDNCATLLFIFLLSCLIHVVVSSILLSSTNRAILHCGSSTTLGRQISELRNVQGSYKRSLRAVIWSMIRNICSSIQPRTGQLLFVMNSDLTIIVKEVVVLKRGKQIDCTRGTSWVTLHESCNSASIGESTMREDATSHSVAETIDFPYASKTVLK